jgi:phosphate transport system substrate-binding protein
MRKAYNYYLIIFYLFLSCSCSIFKPKAVYDNVSVWDYQPFIEKTKVAKLSERAILKLENNLPILDGATALYPLYTAFVQAVYPVGEYPRSGEWNEDYTAVSQPVVTSSRTSEAYNNLINGKVDIIFCAKPSKEQIEKAYEKGLTFNMVPIGKEAFVFFVNKHNSVSDLSTEQIRSIYSGRINNWSELGGKNRPIKIYQRPENTGSQTMLKSIMGEEKIIEPLTEEVLTFMLDIVTETAVYRNYNNAIGYSFLFYTTEMVQNDQIKLLSINGIYPSKETIQSNMYPYSDEFYAITTNIENENANKFIKWILSEQGQHLVAKTGYVPIK